MNSKLYFLLLLFLSLSFLSCEKTLGDPTSREKQYYENGNLKLEEEYKNQKLHGKTIGYFEDGTIMLEMNYKNGKIHGPWKEYYDNGNVKTEGNYKNNKKEGVQKVYYPNGKLRTICNFKGGKVDGVVESYDEDGNITVRITYKDGNKISTDVLNTSNLSDNEVIDYILTQAEQGDLDAQLFLARVYDKGEYGVAQDYKESAKWTRKAAEQGHARAQAFLGHIYRTGKGVTKNYQEAVKWYTRAAEQGNLMAQLALAHMYEEGKEIAQDHTKAIKWCTKAAEQGDAAAQCLLGMIYGDEKSGLTNYQEAVKWYTRAAEQGDAMSQKILAGMYHEGKGVTKDYKKSVKWLIRSSEQGYALAQYGLALAYFSGEGIPENYVEGYKWLILSYANGCESAKDLKKKILPSLSSSQIVEAQRLAASFEPQKESFSLQKEETPIIKEKGLKANGTGFFITSNGFLLTSYHVISGSNVVKIRTSKGLLPVEIINIDPINDIALLKAKGNFKALPLVASSQVNLGDSIITMGYPNIIIQGINPKLTKGSINSLSGIQDDPRHFQVSVPIQPGNSGGPLVDEFGSAVGILDTSLNEQKTFELTGTLPQNINYALKSSYVLAWLETIPELMKNLKKPNDNERRAFKDVVKEVEDATVLVLVY